MPYYRCPYCALTVLGVTGRFATRVCPRCSVPLEPDGQVHSPEREGAALSRRLVAEPRAASAVRRQLKKLLRELDPAELQVTSLLTTELIANAVEHGSPARGSVRVEVSLHDDVVRVAVGDEGSGFEPARRAPDAPLDSHWGVHLVDLLADRWGVLTDPQTVVWFELDTSRPAQGADTAARCHDARTATMAATRHSS